jgi:hypothetical protein
MAQWEMSTNVLHWPPSNCTLLLFLASFWVENARACFKTLQEKMVQDLTLLAFRFQEKETIVRGF